LGQYVEPQPQRILEAHLLPLGGDAHQIHQRRERDVGLRRMTGHRQHRPPVGRRGAPDLSDHSGLAGPGQPDHHRRPLPGGDKLVHARQNPVAPDESVDLSTPRLVSRPTHCLSVGPRATFGQN